MKSAPRLNPSLNPRTFIDYLYYLHISIHIIFLGGSIESSRNVQSDRNNSEKNKRIGKSSQLARSKASRKIKPRDCFRFAGTLSRKHKQNQNILEVKTGKINKALQRTEFSPPAHVFLQSSIKTYKKQTFVFDKHIPKHIFHIFNNFSVPSLFSRANLCGSRPVRETHEYYFISSSTLRAFCQLSSRVLNSQEHQRALDFLLLFI